MRDENDFFLRLKNNVESSLTADNKASPAGTTVDSPIKGINSDLLKSFFDEFDPTKVTIVLPSLQMVKLYRAMLKKIS